MFFLRILGVLLGSVGLLCLLGVGLVLATRGRTGARLPYRGIRTRRLRRLLDAVLHLQVPPGLSLVLSLGFLLGVDEDLQKEHSSIALVDVIPCIQKTFDFPLAPLEGRKSPSFRAGLDADEQPSSFYQLPVG